MQVSIHAPARARTAVTVNQKRATAFQSTRPRGREPPFSLNSVSALWFQSTRPRGRERTGKKYSCTGICFNPRARAGANYFDQDVYQENSVSIHAPARARTERSKEREGKEHVSIHAPARARTRLLRQGSAMQ